MKRKSKELLQYKKKLYLHDELDLCCEDLTKEELKPSSQCLSNEEIFIAVVTFA